MPTQNSIIKLRCDKMKERYLPINEKYCLDIQEASEYFNIGDKKLRKIIAENPNADFILYNGIKCLIKRSKFEEYLDNVKSI